MLRENDIRTSAVYAWLGLYASGCAGAHAGDPKGASPAPTVSASAEATKLAAEEREIAFQNAELKLVGTLSLPERLSGARSPAVVLVGGSGPQSRDESLSGQLDMSFGFSIPVFRLLAAGLRVRGIAVLRYDKRSCGMFNACAVNDYPLPSAQVVVDDFEHDAISAVDYLKTLPEIDAARVSIMGHSEGGSFVIPILSERADIASGVMIAAPFEPADRNLAYQTDFSRQLLQQSGSSEAKIIATLAPLVSALYALAEIRKGTYAGGPILGGNATYWASLLELGDKNPSLSVALDRPLLALGGSYDWNVPPSELSSWQTNFQSALHPEGRSTELLACMTHALNCISQPDATKVTPSDIGSNLQPELVDTIARFVASH